MQKSRHLQRSGLSWISNIEALQNDTPEKIALPTWILMLVLLIGVIIIPAQVAEEKEKKLILGLLQTPVHETEWLAAKVLLGMILIFTAVGILFLLGKFNALTAGFAVFLTAGGLCFSSLGIFLGFLCRDQASARALGVIFYLPLLVPCALSDFSEKLNRIAYYLPSYRFYGPIKSMLSENGRISNFLADWAYLFLFGALMLVLSNLLLKKRWLM